MSLAGYQAELALYLALRRATDVQEVEREAGTLTLFAEEELADAQVGYGVDADGTDLSSQAPGAWKPAWVVIGEEPLHGDPLVVDLAVENFPVLALSHDGDEWQADLVAESFPKLLEALLLVEAAEEPFGDEELDALLGAIHRGNPEASLVLWEEWLAPEED